MSDPKGRIAIMKTKTNMKAGGLLGIGIIVAVAVGINLGGGGCCKKHC
jgi:hypothetical protein